MSIESEQIEHYRAVRQRLWTKPAPKPVPPPMTPARDRMIALIGRMDAKQAREVIHTFSTVQPKTESPIFRRVTWKTIALDVCSKYGVSMLDLLSHRRDRQIVKARYEAFWRCRVETTMSLTQMGTRFNRDHTSCLHGIRKHTERIEAGEAE